MKKFIGILFSITIFFAVCFSGCEIYDGNFKKVTVLEAENFIIDKLPSSVDRGGMQIDIRANVYGEKSTTFYRIALSDGDLQMYGKSNPVGIKAEFYYSEGYVYAKSEFDGEVHKIKQQKSLSEVIFGTSSLPNIDDRIYEELLFDPNTLFEKFKTNDDSLFYVESTKEYEKIKVVLKTIDYYPQADHEITSTVSLIMVFDKEGNYVASKICVKDIRVSREYTEKSNITVTVNPFDKKIELPSQEELSNYRDVEL